MILPETYVDPDTDQGIVTTTFVPVAVPLFEIVSVCVIRSSLRRVPPLSSPSTALDKSTGALIVTGTLGIPPMAHSALFPTFACVGMTVPGARVVSAVTW